MKKQKSKTEKTACYLCGSEQQKQLMTFQFHFINSFYDTPMRFVECPDCKLRFINPRLDQKTMLDYCQTDPYDWKFDDEKVQQMFHIRESHLRQYLKLIGKMKTGKILDVGCSYGFFLRMAKDIGWDARGVELSCEHAKYARQGGQLTIYDKYLDELDIPDNQYDVITCMQQIYYSWSPIEDFVTYKRILKPDGILAIDFANKYLYHRMWQAIRKLLKKNHSLENNPFFDDDHQIFYTQKTMKLLLKKAGFNHLKWYNQKFSSRPEKGVSYTIFTKLLFFLFQIVWYMTGTRVCMTPSVLVVAYK